MCKIPEVKSHCLGQYFVRDFIVFFAEIETGSKLKNKFDSNIMICSKLILNICSEIMT